METELLDIRVNKTEAVQRAVEQLKLGEAVAFPTETVYGLGADLFNADACAKIFAAKNRPPDSPLSAHISDLSHVNMLCKNIPENFWVLADIFMPGPIGIILNAQSIVPSIVTAGGNTIGIRFPDEPTCKALINAFGKPIAATSANISGKPSPTDASHVYDDLNGRIAAILDGGKCRYNIESTIISLSGSQPVILRQGVISKQEIESVLKCEVLSKQADIITKYKHYSPEKQVIVFNDYNAFKDYLEVTKLKTIILSNLQFLEPDSRFVQYELSQDTFYSRLRECDKSDCDIIAVFVDHYAKQSPALMERISVLDRQGL